MKIASLKQLVKIIGFILLLGLVLITTIFLGRSASNYFAKASTCPTQNVTATQVTANSAVISWATADISQGRVEYGTNPANLTISVPEATAGKVHNVPLTLLTPNTIYYYLIAVGNTRCDASAQVCDQTCVPWSFTTSPIVLQEEVVVTNTPVPPSPTQSVEPTVIPTQETVSATQEAPPASNLSPFCQQVKEHLGSSSQDAASWSSIEQYDMDVNGIINGLDIIKCQQSGK